MECWMLNVEWPYGTRIFLPRIAQIFTEGNHSPSSVVIREIRVIKKTQRSPQADANANCYFKEHESHESIE